MIYLRFVAERCREAHRRKQFKASGKLQTSNKTLTEAPTNMIIQHLTKLRSMDIVLASGSPRRKEILQTAGLSIRIIPSHFEETLDPKSFANPWEYAIATAKGKAEEVAERLKGEGQTPDFVIGADTCVYHEGIIYGKPKDPKDAFDTLSRDKAGCYGIQALGSMLVESIDGDYFNVMGFPIHRFSVNLSKLL
ncbi:putative bifunctional dTTP/UTP pyrophosphatase/methyltransferase protein isoform X5 [Oratosquilla oratoria]|uniref:putative bifunctional dTTP/UTP pyrophosphatase/methyltransferase protein isoform X5 n=1 Tax=Oratosquilla oratoria TaxID=337810 RepID=UPI003F7744E4